jgi:hypothetical protein
MTLLGKSYLNMRPMSIVDLVVIHSFGYPDFFLTTNITSHIIIL